MLEKPSLTKAAAAPEEVAITETSDAPIVFYTYYNLVFANGVDAYVRAAKAAGVDGILTLDLPPEEAGEFGPHARTAGLDLIRLATDLVEHATQEDLVGRHAREVE